jgi:hypothetical protein
MTSIFIGLQYENVIGATLSHPGEPESEIGRGRPAPELDELTVAHLTGAARRHASGRERTDAETAAAVTELTEIAGSRGDLLAEAAGLLVGFYRHTAEQTRAEAAAHHCIASGADLDLIPRWIELGRRRAVAAQRTSGTGPYGYEGHPSASSRIRSEVD